MSADKIDNREGNLMNTRKHKVNLTLSKEEKDFINALGVSQLTFTCSKSTKETLEKGVDFGQVSVCWGLL